MRVKPTLFDAPLPARKYLMNETRLLGTVHGARHLKTHRGLFHWLQRDVQSLLPHDILVAAWGDFDGGRISLDVVSALPGVRTTEALSRVFAPILSGVFKAWIDAGRVPISSPLENSDWIAAGEADAVCVSEMRCAVAHGIRDERGGIDCLYVALSRQSCGSLPPVEAMEVLLPYIDAAFRKVALLPMQRDVAQGAANQAGGRDDGAIDDPGVSALSRREHEIMQWVKAGKTNVEIAQILGISARTVRNHLQNVFRKLDVINRAQAVFEVERRRSE